MNTAVTFLAFTASWCAPCGDFKRDFADDASVQIVDIDDNPDFARDYGIQTVPTVVAVRGGNEVGRTVGYIGKPTMSRWMQRMKGERRARTLIWAR